MRDKKLTFKLESDTSGEDIDRLVHPTNKLVVMGCDYYDMTVEERVEMIDRIKAWTDKEALHLKDIIERSKREY